MMISFKITEVFGHYQAWIGQSLNLDYLKNPFLSSVTPVNQILKKCTGQRVSIPFLFSFFPAWQAEFNTNYSEEIEKGLNNFQRRWIENPAGLRRNQGIDCVFFSRSVFPDAKMTDLQIAVEWISWLYFWDDALDFGELDNKPDELDRSERELLHCIRQSLFGDGTIDEDPTALAPTCRAAQAWYKIGVRIRESVQSLPSREFMYACLHDYITATIELQKHCNNEKILDIESYLEIRMNTSGVYPTISMYLLTSHSDPHIWFLSHELVKNSLLQMNIIISLYNDIVSARHEIESGHIDNIIPLLVHHKGLSPQAAIDEAVQMMRTSYARFQELEEQLNALGKTHNIEKEVNDFLRGCINLCMGGLQWTYHIKRYFDYEPNSGNVAMSVVLGHSN